MQREFLSLLNLKSGVRFVLCRDGVVGQGGRVTRVVQGLCPPFLPPALSLDGHLDRRSLADPSTDHHSSTDESGNL